MVGEVVGVVIETIEWINLEWLKLERIEQVRNGIIEQIVNSDCLRC
jgi:hypothetical protein